MNELYELKEKLMKELEEYGTQELTAGSLEVIDKLSHAIKNICKIIEADEEYSMDGGNYSRTGGGNYSRTGGRNYSRNGGYSRDGGSYARERNRDSMGRYSRADGVDELIESVRGMMHELPQNLQMDAKKFIQKLEQEM